MIKKYTSIEEAEEYNWIMNPDVDYYKKMNDFFKMIEKLSSFKVKRGVHKLNSLKDKVDVKG